MDWSVSITALDGYLLAKDTAITPPPSKRQTIPPPPPLLLVAQTVLLKARMNRPPMYSLVERSVQAGSEGHSQGWANSRVGDSIF